MHILLKRGKIFRIKEGNGGEQRWTGGPGQHSNVPDWIQKTLTYEYGVQDGSIVDITPAKKTPTPVPLPPAPEDEDTKAEVGDGEQQAEIEDAPAPTSNKRRPAGKITAA